MTAASRSRVASAALVVALAGLLAACTGGPSSGVAGPAGPRTTAALPSPSRASSAAKPTATPRRPTPTAPAPPTLPPVPGSSDDLGRVDIHGGSPTKKRTNVRLPAGSGYTVTVGCLGRPGALLHWSVIGTSDAYPGFLFGSTTPCDGAVLSDRAMANIEETAPTWLEVALDPGVRDATVVLRPAPAEAHL